MAQGYERKDNRSKMYFKGIWTKDHHVKDFPPDFCPSVFLFYFWCSLFSWDSFSLPFFFLFLAFVLFARFRFQQGEFGIFFFFEHQNLIVHDFDRTFLVLAFSMKGDPWSGLMKEIIRLKRGITSG